MTYEVFHSWSGHCGPFQTLNAAIKYAERYLKGMRSTRAFDREVIRERTADGAGGYGKVVATVTLNVIQVFE